MSTPRAAKPTPAPASWAESDPVVLTLVSVLKFLHEAVYQGGLARADLPMVGKLRDLPPWAVAREKLSPNEHAVLLPWWSAQSRLPAV